MISRSKWVWTPLLLVALLAMFSCGGGGNGDTTPTIGPAFNLCVSADPEVGAAPLMVTFHAVPSGGSEPYTYAWDFDGDGVIDSNASSGQFNYTESSVLSVTVTDNDDNEVSASRTITITGDAPVSTNEPLDVRFNATPQSGYVPFNVQFTSFVDGGKAPYSYSWDFNGDGVYDSFLENPLYTYEEVGQEVTGETGRYAFYPLLRVEDSRGVIGTNFDDNDDNGNPDFKIQINAAPPLTGLQVTASANPLTGQAPLFVEFTGAVSGGSDDYTFEWEFGDGDASDPLTTSIVTHTYLNPGTYKATLTVTDNKTAQTKESYPLTINATYPQEFEISITSDANNGQVPFVANFQANPVNGREPILFEWDVFNDQTPLEVTPDIGEYPVLAAKAVVTPDYSTRMNPTIHFGNTAGTGADFAYAVRCVATDASGNVAVSNLIRVTASPNDTFPFYECIRPDVIGSTIFPVNEGGESADAQFQAYPMPVPWDGRANAAVCSHPTGISYIIGGEQLDENGNFESLVDRGDSMYMFIPATGGTGTGEGLIGKWTTGGTGVMVKLNDDTAPPFPGTPTSAPGSPSWLTDLDNGDTVVPAWLEPDEDPASPPGSVTQRSAPFEIVGSAAAVYMHERPETNPAGAYPGPGFWATANFPMGESLDRDYQGFPSIKLWPWPDQACHGWGCDAGG